MTKNLLGIILQKGMTLGSILFLYREKSFENSKVDLSELVTMTTDETLTGVRVHIRLMKYEHNVSKFWTQI